MNFFHRILFEHHFLCFFSGNSQSKYHHCSLSIGPLVNVDESSPLTYNNEIETEFFSNSVGRVRFHDSFEPIICPMMFFIRIHPMLSMVINLKMKLSYTIPVRYYQCFFFSLLDYVRRGDSLSK